MFQPTNALAMMHIPGEVGLILFGIWAVFGLLLIVGGPLAAFLFALVGLVAVSLWQGERLIGDGVLSVLLSASALAGAILLALSSRRFARRSGLASSVAIDATSAGAVEAAAPALVGRHGIARSALRPGGRIVLDGQEFNAVCADGAFIQQGAAVEVRAARFGELVVVALPAVVPDATPPAAGGSR